MKNYARKSVAIALFAPISLMIFTGCASPKSTNNSSAVPIITASDIAEITISNQELPSKKRVVALANGSAEIIYAMGFKSILVGRDIASTMPALSSVAIVTSGHQVIPEKIISLNPDVVLVDASTGPSSALTSLKSSAQTLVQIPEAWSLRDIAKKVTSIGEAIGAPKSAAALNVALGSAIKSANIGRVPAPKIAFLYLRGTSSIFLMGGPGSGADSLITAIGAVDVGAQSLPHPFNSLTSEALVKANPDVILVMTKGMESVGGLKGLLALPGVAQTSAGINQRVIAVDDSLLLSFGPRTPGLVGALAKALVKVMK